MKYIRRKTGEVELDIKDELSIGEGDELVYESNEPKIFYGSWMNPENEEYPGEPKELGTYENAIEMKLSADKRRVGWHEPKISTKNPVRLCAYCGKKLPTNSRSDRKYCDKKCRQNDRYHKKIKVVKGPEKIEGEPMANGVKII